MKGLEWKLLIGIILVVVAAVILITVFGLPIFAIGPETTEELNFRFYCDLWAAEGYKGTEIERKDKPTVDMNEPCTKHLKLDCASYPECMATNSDWKRCIAECKVTIAEG